MVFYLDYSKRSDMDDSVGYWYVEGTPLGCRVYYSQDTLLPGWIPAGLRKSFSRVALVSCTKKLEPCCLAAHAQSLRGPGPLRGLNQLGGALRARVDALRDNV